MHSMQWVQLRKQNPPDYPVFYHCHHRRSVDERRRHVEESPTKAKERLQHTGGAEFPGGLPERTV